VGEGETPHSLTVICYDNNVDGIRPGDRVEIVGIYRAQSVKIQRIKSSLKSVFNTYVDLISFRVLEENRFRTE
jgi:DNA replication licensing factor MCM4